MELTFDERRKLMTKKQKNIMYLGIIIWIVALLIFFGFGGYLSDLTIKEVPLLSIDGIIKIAAIICTLILFGIVLFPGPLIVLVDIDYYYYLKY